MAKTSSKSRKNNNNKNKMVGACAAVIVLVVIIVAVVIGISNANRLGDSYFVSDDSKYVLTYDIDPSTIEEGSEGAQYAPLKIHAVYTYEGDKITGLKEYYEYKDSASAKSAFDSLKSSSNDEKTEIAIEDKYVILTAPAEQYEGVSASTVKSQIEIIEKMKNEKNNSGETNNGSGESNDDSVNSGETTETEANK